MPLLPRRRAVPILELLTCLALAARASASSVGGHIAWDTCFGDGGTRNRAFACDTNTGSEGVIMSYVPDVNRPELLAIELTVQFQSSAATLPPWWELRTPIGSQVVACRNGAVSIPGDPTFVTCQDWAAGQAAGIGSRAQASHHTDFGLGFRSAEGYILRAIDEDRIIDDDWERPQASGGPECLVRFSSHPCSR